MALVEEPARKRARVSHGPVVLAAVLSGVSLAELSETKKISLKRLERALRSELRKRWVAPARDHARLQIARLEIITTQLKKQSESGDLPTIDRLLKVMDRLDRYHGLTKFAALSGTSREDVREPLLLRLAQRARSPVRDK